MKDDIMKNKIKYEIACLVTFMSLIFVANKINVMINEKHDVFSLAMGVVTTLIILLIAFWYGEKIFR